jgi:transposase-like protein
MADVLTVRQFFRRFPDDAACLDHIMAARYGMRHVCRACGAEATFHRIAGRRAFACAHCGDHVYPCAGTIFEDSRTPLQLWFYAIYLSVATRRGLSGKELQRRLGVTYKAAWRMRRQICRFVADGDGSRAGAFVRRRDGSEAPSHVRSATWLRRWLTSRAGSTRLPESQPDRDRRPQRFSRRKDRDGTENGMFAAAILPA